MALIVKKRSEEAKKRRDQKKHRAQKSDPQKPYLLARPHVHCNHEFDCVAIDCKMLIIHADYKEDKIALSSVGIVDRVSNCLYEHFLAPPSDRHIDQRARRFCPVMDTQFLYASRDEDIQFLVVRSQLTCLLSHCQLP